MAANLSDHPQQNSLLSESDFVTSSTPMALNPDACVPSGSDHTLDITSETSTNQDDMEIIGDADSDLEDDSNHPRTSENSPQEIDNNSLLDALRLHNDANFTALNNMMSTTIAGAMHQLKTDLTSEFHKSLEKHRSEIVTLKQNTSEQLSKIDLKLSSNIGEINTRINTLGDKVDKFEDILVKNKVHKINDLLSENSHKLNEVSTQCDSFNKRIHNCERKDLDLVEAVTFLGNQIDDLQKKIANNEANLKRTNTHCDVNEIGQSRLNTRITNLETKALSSDTRHRKLNLIFEGIDEAPNENAKGLITNIFNNSGGLASAAGIDTAYRLGRTPDNYNRPILVAFHTLEAKDNVLRNAAKIKLATNMPNLWINRDHPDITRRQIANTRRCYNLMRSNKHKCTLQGTSITFNGRVYHYKDLNNLPEGSRIEDTRMITCNNGTEICFQSELSYLSNFYRAHFVYKDKPFTSSEQAFQWSKAIYSSDFEKAKKIMALEDPYSIKQIGSEILVKDQSSLSEIGILHDINYAKFSQNRQLGERLRTSPYMKFHECTRSLFWGTGQTLPNSTREIDHTTFAGENYFGKILFDIRAKLNNDAKRRSFDGNAPVTSPSRSPAKSTVTPPYDLFRKSPVGSPAGSPGAPPGKLPTQSTAKPPAVTLPEQPPIQAAGGTNTKTLTAPQQVQHGAAAAIN